MRLTPATEADVDTMVDIHREARETYYRGVVPDTVLNNTADLHAAYLDSVRDPRRTVLIADGAGFLSLGLAFDRTAPDTVAQLVGLYVRPADWGRGVGGALHDAGLAAWRAAGVAVGHLEVWAGNKRAAAFYARRGWRADGHRREGPGGLDHVRLVLPLGG
ncbi:GNAT family N-acetyltransferase [Dactylosporangium fulvum]|uniref:GNAT family N-acetyltransferase n=1 Tax=Dactylosporangium fulvum TaxID=53359 RepID=A0ABY5W9L2_9ACTN|nr:GNAT family protein [Dactylosporangium fulvum]UWP86247.1 GNAT family N-acetyltransferase [Dactylosporangium fulvum]